MRVRRSCADFPDFEKFFHRNVTDGLTARLKEGDLFTISTVRESGSVDIQAVIAYAKRNGSFSSIFVLFLSGLSLSASNERLLDIA